MNEMLIMSATVVGGVVGFALYDLCKLLGAKAYRALKFLVSKL